MAAASSSERVVSETIQKGVGDGGPTLSGKMTRTLEEQMGGRIVHDKLCLDAVSPVL